MEGLAQHFLHEKPSSWARRPFMIKAASATRADQILEALGVDLDVAEMQADALATTPNDPSKIKGFTYREPAPLPPQALEAQMRRELENMYRGPGTYEAATTHREWITDDEDNRPALMSRATGRERVSVRRKGALRTIPFTEADFQQQDPDLAALGPGRYQVSSRVSRFGVEKSRAPDMDRMNASSRFEKAQELDNHAPILELDAVSAKERTKKKAPGAAGYAFSKLPSNRQGSGNARQQDDSFPNIDFGSGAGDEAFLDLEPDREKFKYKRTQELVPMDKLPQRFSPDKRGRGDGDRQSKDEYENEYLALDPERGRAFLRKRSRAANMSMGSPRNLLPVQIQDEFGEGDEALPVVFESETLSRNLDAVKPRVVRHVPDFAKAPKRFPDEESESVHPAPKGHVNMRKQPGRQVKGAPPDILSEIDARAARDAPSQNLRVVGGVIPAADDRAAPMSAHARALAEQGNVLELNPDPTPLLKRKAAGTLAMETQTGRSSPVCDIHSPGVLMASPVHPDVRASEHFLKPRVIGGAVGLETDVPKPILTHRQEERAHEERTFKVNQAGKNAQLRKAIRSERKQAVARARGDKENDSGKQRRTRPPRTTKVKSGKTIPRAQKVL
ncbi:Hypothetical Protein FCC1311_044802 [Hondaea fermentalgiana]|uniref:Uncharacterized protein n=1 Tax=Hondaea fermentalgiana TaxID=2315210 RepID=A0A2R5GB76_9STRA|nr:Hypothetical Protein FCC1311_044802 [Hondaea fermentalgiana]|eukprot:GBG28257.1 Hypothetical Protein FCC1311_044802 [Hondaea fermentalgiana]